MIPRQWPFERLVSGVQRTSPLVNLDPFKPPKAAIPKLYFTHTLAARHSRTIDIPTRQQVIEARRWVVRAHLAGLEAADVFFVGAHRLVAE